MGTVANFAGRSVIGSSSDPPSTSSLVTLVLGRMLFIWIIIYYLRGGFPWVLAHDSLNLGIACMYFMMSFSGGVATMWLSKKSQSMCGQPRHTMPNRFADHVVVDSARGPCWCGTVIHQGCIRKLAFLRRGH